MVSLFGWLKKRKQARAVKKEELQKQSVLESYSAEERPLVEAIYFRHVCPDCNGGSFFMGPSGGMGQNIKCGNSECGSEFCIAPFEDGVWHGEPLFIERLTRTEAESIQLYRHGYGPKAQVAGK